MADELKACPFCQAIPERVSYEGEAGYVECPGCRLIQGYFETEQEARDAWNKRPEEQWLRARVADLEAEVEAVHERAAKLL